MCLDEYSLKNIWISLFKPEICSKVEGVHSTIVGPLLLAERTVLAFKELGLNYVNTLQEVKVTQTYLDSATKELKILREKLNETQKPCENCNALDKELSLAKKRANAAEFRVTQIAKILVVSSTNDENNENLKSPSKSPKRKRTCNRDKEEIDPNFSSQTVETGYCSSSLSPDNNTKNVISPKKSPKKSGSPRSRKVADAVTRTELENESSRKISPCRNLNAEFNFSSPTSNKEGKCNRESKNSSNEKYNDHKRCLSEIRGVNDSFAEYAKKYGSELDKLWFSDNSNAAAKVEKKENEQIVNTSLQSLDDLVCSPSADVKPPKDLDRNLDYPRTRRSNRSLRSDKLIKNPDNTYDLIFEKKIPKKKFKQLTLQMKQTNKQKVEEESDPEDIVLASPDKLCQDDDDFASTFAPGATSTQQPANVSPKTLGKSKTPSPIKHRCKTPSPIKQRPMSSNRHNRLDNSFDVILDKRKTTPSPNYKYKGKTVRGKARAHLQGWDCDECKKFYEIACKNQSPSKVRAKMNFCSRHRSKYNHARPPTPPGFWDLDIPDTPE